MTPEALIAGAVDRLPGILDFLRRLVSVNSFTTNAAGVAEVARLTAEAFADLGFEAAMIDCETPETGPHLFLSRFGEGDPIVLVTHSDTVFPEHEERENGFVWEERDDEGRIYGPGTIDNKGGTALILLMLQLLHEHDRDAFESAHWIVAANAAEEIIGDDFARATRELCQGRARAVLVFEGGPREADGWHLVVSRKGRSTWKLEAEGRAAHAGSQHHAGINAIDALASVLPQIAALTSASANRTVNIGHIVGGTVVNRVPHEASASWECRASEPDSLEEADRFFASLNGSAPNGATLRAKRTGFTRPWPGGEGTSGLFDCWEAAAEVFGETVRSVPRGGLSDANHLAGLGPVLDGLGPSGGNAHCSERSADGSKVPEFIATETVVLKAAMNALALSHLIRQRETGPR